MPGVRLRGPVDARSAGRAAPRRPRPASLPDGPKLHRSLLLLVCALAIGAARSHAVAADDEPLPTDPSLVTGTLENGLRYVVRRHAVPPGRALMWLHLHTGSLNETDPQRGIAHYLEHMAFNGSAHFPAGSLIPFFQSLGMTFGRDQNAFTSFDQTTYQLSLPDVKPETLTKGLTFFSDVTHQLLLSPKEIESERQIIQEERRTRLSGRQRTSDAVRKRIAPGSRLGDRAPIGTPETIDSVKESDFRDYYGTWYGASNATLMVVADADPALVVRLLGEAFGAAPKRPRPTPVPSGVRAYTESFAVVASDAEINSEDLEITRMEPARPPATTVARLRDELVLSVGESALNRRLEDKVAAGGTSYVRARVGSGSDGATLWSWTLSCRAAPGRWKAALEESALELQRARAFGFTAREVEDVKKQWIASAERGVETEATVPAQALMTRLNGDVTSGEAMLSPAQRLDLLRRLLPAISTEEVGRRFAAEYDPKAVAFVATLPSALALPTEAQLLELGTKALAAKPTQEVAATHATRLMAELPKPGTVKEGEEHPATKVWSGWLGNDVRVHHLFMDTRKNEVSIDVSLLGGELHETAANRGITTAAQLAWSRPATKSLSSNDVRDLMLGRKASVRGGGGGGRRGGRGGGGGGGGSPGWISLTISGSPDDLESAFQLTHLLLTQPRIEASAFAQLQATLRQMLPEALKNPATLGMRTAASVPYPDDDTRLQPLTPEEVDRLTLEASQAFLERLVAESPIEVTIVGDLPRERALELVTRYLGSLPARPRVSPRTYEALRTLARPKGPRVRALEIDSPTPQAFVSSGFYGADETNVADARALSMAASILSTRMTTEVREQAQLVYSIGVGSRPGSVFPGFGTFSAAAPTEPHKVAALVEKLASMYAAFSASGPTEEELTVAKKQVANTFAEQLKDPAWWMSRLERMTFRGTRLDDVLGAPAAYQAMTAQQVRETFARYATKEASLVVTVTPKAAPAGPKPEAPKPGAPPAGMDPAPPQEPTK